MTVTAQSLIIAFILFLPLNINSAEILSCDDLDLIADDLKELYDTFHDVLHDAEELTESAVLDNILSDVSDNLHIVSSTKNNNKLLGNINSMEDAWINKKHEMFAAAMDDAIDNLDRLIQKECN